MANLASCRGCDRPRSLRGAVESYSDVILRLAGSGEPRIVSKPGRVMRR